MSFTRGVPFQLSECLNQNKTQILLFEKFNLKATLCEANFSVLPCVCPAFSLGSLSPWPDNPSPTEPPSQ